jgi:hypothetical protein
MSNSDLSLGPSANAAPIEAAASATTRFGSQLDR